MKVARIETPIRDARWRLWIFLAGPGMGADVNGDLVRAHPWPP